MAENTKNTLVWAEIPAADFERAVAFYEAVLGEPLKRNNMGPNPMADLPMVGDTAVAGHIYPGKPAPRGEGATVHLAAPCSLADAMARIKDNGGEVVSDVIEIPPGNFFYAIDTEGNSIGIFETT